MGGTYDAAEPDTARGHTWSYSPYYYSAQSVYLEQGQTYRMSLQNMLALWGLQYDGCADGDAALALWQPGRYTMVLSDWRLPGAWNGGQLIAALQAQPGAASTRFALLTGESEAGIGTLPAGVELLHKPVRPIRLRALLSAVAPV